MVNGGKEKRQKQPACTHFPSSLARKCRPSPPLRSLPHFPHNPILHSHLHLHPHHLHPKPFKLAQNLGILVPSLLPPVPQSGNANYHADSLDVVYTITAGSSRSELPHLHFHVVSSAVRTNARTRFPMGLSGAEREKAGHVTLLSRIGKLHYACTILLGVSIFVYYFFAFSIGVFDCNNAKLLHEQHLHPKLYSQQQHPPWLISESPTRRWRALQSSGVAPAVAQPQKSVVAAEKALQGMGTLFRRGTRPMRELIVAHLADHTTLATLRLFLRTLHRSGATARADVVLLFPSPSIFYQSLSVVQEEETYFQQMLTLSATTTSPSKRNPSGGSNSTLSVWSFMTFKQADEEQHVRGEVIWGRRRGNDSSQGDGGGNETAVGVGYGSVAGFEMQDLDPHNVLSGFFDDPPAELRRWVCYEMLLGMVRTKYRNTLVTQAGVVFLGDPLGATRRRQHLYLSAEDRSWLDVDAEEFLEPQETANASSSTRGRGLLEVEEDENANTNANIEEDANLNPPPKHRSSKKKGVVQEQVRGLIPSVYGKALWQSLDKAHREKVVVTSSFAMGRIEFVRKLANKMTTELVRIALEKKTRRPFHDKAVLNYLVHQSSVLGKRVLDHMRIVPNKDSVVHSLVGSRQPHVFWKRKGKGYRYAIIQGLNNTRSPSDFERGRKIVAGIHSDICQSPAESQVYPDCLPGHAPGLFSW